MIQKKKIRRIKWKNVILFLIINIFLIIIIISTIKITKWLLDKNKIDKQINNINNSVNIVEIEDTENTEIIEQDNISEDNPYWDYIKMKLIDVNFKKLKEINSATKGWIKVNGTNINYPFVQGEDNSYYLSHSFDKTYNNAGWVFLDYRNNNTELDKNTIIYAHGRIDGTMFGSLKNILTSNWLNYTDNYIVKLSTEEENTLWQVFSIYHIPTTNDYIKVNFSNNEDFLNFTKMLLNRSVYNFNTTVSETDKILTLSTCYNNKEKIVLHAKLIKREKK